MIIETIILKTHYVWRITRRGVVPVAHFWDPQSHHKVTPQTLGRASEEQLLAWTTHSWQLGMQHIHTSLDLEHPWLPTLDLTAASTAKTQDIPSSTFPATSLSKVCPSQRWGHIPLILAERKLMQDHTWVQSQQNYLVRTFVKNEEEKMANLIFSLRSSYEKHPDLSYLHFLPLRIWKYITIQIHLT